MSTRRTVQMVLLSLLLALLSILSMMSILSLQPQSLVVDSLMERPADATENAAYVHIRRRRRLRRLRNMEMQDTSNVQANMTDMDVSNRDAQRNIHSFDIRYQLVVQGNVPTGDDLDHQNDKVTTFEETLRAFMEQLVTIVSTEQYFMLSINETDTIREVFQQFYSQIVEWTSCDPFSEQNNIHEIINSYSSSNNSSDSTVRCWDVWHQIHTSIMPTIDIDTESENDYEYSHHNNNESAIDSSNNDSATQSDNIHDVWTVQDETFNEFFMKNTRTQEELSKSRTSILYHIADLFEDINHNIIPNSNTNMDMDMDMDMDIDTDMDANTTTDTKNVISFSQEWIEDNLPASIELIILLPRANFSNNNNVNDNDDNNSNGKGQFERETTPTKKQGSRNRTSLELPNWAVAVIGIAGATSFGLIYFLFFQEKKSNANVSSTKKSKILQNNKKNNTRLEPQEVASSTNKINAIGTTTTTSSGLREGLHSNSRSQYSSAVPSSPSPSPSPLMVPVLASSSKSTTTTTPPSALIPVSASPTNTRPKKSILKKSELQGDLYEKVRRGTQSTPPNNHSSLIVISSSSSSSSSSSNNSSTITSSGHQQMDHAIKSIITTPTSKKNKQFLTIDATGKVTSIMSSSPERNHVTPLMHVFEDGDDDTDGDNGDIYTADEQHYNSAAASRKYKQKDVATKTLNTEVDTMSREQTTPLHSEQYMQTKQIPSSDKIVRQVTPERSDEEIQSVEHGKNTFEHEEIIQEDLLYGGVYYGSDMDDDFVEDQDSIDSEKQVFPQSTEMQSDLYGGVYYGSDEDEDEDDDDGAYDNDVGNKHNKHNPSLSRIQNTVDCHREHPPDVNPPPMNYFAGIHYTQSSGTDGNRSNKRQGTTTGKPTRRSKPSMNAPCSNNANNTDFLSVNSDLTSDSYSIASSSMISVEEREWQRRNRQDWLLPVTEDDVHLPQLDEEFGNNDTH